MIARRPTRLIASLWCLRGFVPDARRRFASARRRRRGCRPRYQVSAGILESIGLQRDEKIINYQERPPLVIPPSRTLPPPERSDALIANNPNWLKDPDDAAGKGRSRANGVEHSYRRTRQSEMTSGR